MSEPLLSIVFIGRNDGREGDFAYRLQTSLGLWTRHLQRLGALGQVEALVVDFGRETPLRRVLALPQAAAAWVRFLEPPAQFLDAAAPRGEFPGALAANLGLRRARGRQVMFSDADSLLPPWAADRLWEILTGRFPYLPRGFTGLLHVRRYQASGSLAARRPSPAAWERLFHRLPGCQVPEAPHGGCLGGFAAAQILPRAQWHEAAGYDETLRGWGWSDNELMLSICERHSWLDLGVYGVYALHLGHAADERPRPAPNRMTLRGAERAAGWGAPELTLAARPPEIFAPDDPPATLPLPLAALADWRHLEREPIGVARLTRLLRTASAPRALRPALTALMQFSAAAHPCSLVWAGAPDPVLLGAALTANPAIAAYFLAPWPPGDTTDAPVNPSDFSGLLDRHAHQGFALIIGGVMNAAFWPRAESLLGLALPFELGVSRWRPAQAQDHGAAAWFARHLAPGGLWLLTLAPTDNPDQVREQLQPLLPAGTTVDELGRSRVWAVHRPGPSRLLSS